MCILFQRPFGRKVFVICLICRRFKEKLNIQVYQPFKLSFGFTMTCIISVYENVLKFATN